jgi:hypothetical protein
MVIGIFRQHIANIGIPLSVVFSGVNLLVYVMMDEILESLLSNLETRGIKSSTEGLVVPRGSPRYVNGKLSREHPNIAASAYAASRLILIGTKVVLL